MRGPAVVGPAGSTRLGPPLRRDYHIGTQNEVDDMTARLQQNALGDMGLPKEARPYESNDELIQDALTMVQGQQARSQDKSYQAISRDESTTDYWHERVEITGDEVSLAARFRRDGLSRIEREVSRRLVAQGDGSALELDAATDERLAVKEVGHRPHGLDRAHYRLGSKRNPITACPRAA